MSLLCFVFVSNTKIHKLPPSLSLTSHPTPDCHQNLFTLLLELGIRSQSKSVCSLEQLKIHPLFFLIHKASDKKRRFVPNQQTIKTFFSSGTSNLESNWEGLLNEAVNSGKVQETCTEKTCTIFLSSGCVFHSFYTVRVYPYCYNVVTVHLCCPARLTGPLVIFSRLRLYVCKVLSFKSPCVHCTFWIKSGPLL